ncbi:hypothetical protein CY34DRAFT_19860 [Suillus luteus UH-Slu-Lm8-n1]|uniref:Uncharacterized protein n=1 Tax=Suillus luteus UH-Slu-Lm8-n1 TaxID=930992 RepID=A0A0C9Z246_9AGAM|nr:hypothetical protein CY34DRAFT_19860 [Suillus luteus UH-Slu-Lm8-n1]
MAYSHSDESEVDEGKKVDVTIANSAVSPGLVDVPTETSQEDLTKELHDDRPAVDQQEPRQIANPIEDFPDATHNSRDPPPEPAHHDPREGIQQDPLNRELQHEVVPERYTGLQAPDHYGPEPRTDSEFTGRDSSPALELHRDALYGHGEREHTYPSRYSPVLGPDYGREGGYARHDDLDERRAFGGGAYHDSGYPQARARYHDSRWMDHVRNVDAASADYVPRAFNRESTNPPRPPQ